MATRARWSDQEWESVCLQLYRTQPVATMTNINLIQKSDVVKAMQEVIPQERWHRTMNMTHLRPKLKERFGALRGQLQKIEQEQKEAARQREEAERAEAKTRQRVDVFSPLIDVMAERLFQRLVPMLDEYLAQRQSGALSTEAAIKGLEVHKPKVHKIKIGVVGLIPIQEQEVKKYFAGYPSLDITFFDKDKQRGFKTWSDSLDQVFGLTAKMDHGIENQFRSLDRYFRVAGRGTSSMIRAIEVWLASNSQQLDIHVRK